jgi:hypothetical protein
VNVFEAPWSEATMSEAEHGYEGFVDGTPAHWQGEGELESPFRTEPEVSEAEAFGEAQVPSVLESPFHASFSEVSEAEQESGAFHELLAELENEQFDEAIAQLTDEAAGLHLASGTTWSSAEAGPAMAMSELEAWIEPLRQEAHRMLENMADRLEGEQLETLRDSELETLLESLRPDSGLMAPAFENFLGGLFNKAKSLVSGAVRLAKQGIQTVGKVVSAPIRFLLSKLGGVAKAVLKGVLNSAIGLLPGPVQPIARHLAGRLLGEAEAEALAESEPRLANQFDMAAARLMFAESEAEAENIVGELEAETEHSGSVSLSELDDARARLAEQLTQLPPGQAPVAELEQFLPILLAVRPIIQLGLRLIGGRDKLVGFLADKIASLIQRFVGADAARALARPLVDVGLSLIGFEAPEHAETLAGEALAATVEETVDRVLKLPAEAFEDTLRLEAELQEAFAEAASHHIPSEFLRSDLPQLETAGERGVWVLMPRAARPRYRYKKYSRVFLVPITRQVARAIPTADGGTIETVLLDRGVNSWPANAEVHLYEAMPGATHLGQIAQFEGEGETPISEALSDFHPLTPEAAAMLLREPGLGRPLAPPHHIFRPSPREPHASSPPEPSAAPPVQPTAAAPSFAHATVPVDHTVPHPATSATRLARPLVGGHRFFRIRLPGQVRATSARPRHRVGVAIHRHPTPSLHIHIRLSERESQRLAVTLQRNQLPSALALIKHSYHHVLPAVLTARLLRHRTPLPGPPFTEGSAVRFSLSVTEALTRALSGFVRQRRAELLTAVQHATQGVTITFIVDLAAHGSGVPHPNQAIVGVRPGYHPGVPHPRPEQPSFPPRTDQPGYAPHSVQAGSTYPPRPEPAYAPRPEEPSWHGRPEEPGLHHRHPHRGHGV